MKIILAGLPTCRQVTCFWSVISMPTILIGEELALGPRGMANGSSVTSQIVELCLLNDCSYTRLPNHRWENPSIIDLSLISSELFVKSDWQTADDPLGSDHLPITICDTPPRNESLLHSVRFYDFSLFYK